MFNGDPSGVWLGRGPERGQGQGMQKKTPRPRPLSGAGRGKGLWARVFWGRVRRVTNSNLKFGPRSRLCMMLGYRDSEKIWKLWEFEGNGGRGRPVFSSDVRFVETENAWEMRYGSASEETTEGDMFKSYLDQMFDGSET